jgi:hypothetical protein
MAKRLVEHLTTNYLAAAQQLNPRRWRKKIVAYVESYDDILFWKDLLSKVENDKYFFEVMLPSRTSLQKGKKSALMNTLGAGLGQYMIACVDADYDYLMQGCTEVSRMVCTNPYVFHTYAYAIENFQCYAPALHNVCVMATLNDHAIFDFESFMMAYSKLVFPLFVWSIWCYRNKKNQQFNMADLCQVIAIPDINLHNPENALARIAHRVNVRVAELQRSFPEAKGHYQALREELIGLGVTPETTYLYIRGHDIFDKVVTPIVVEVCDALRSEREREIRKYANHQTQRMNELAGYQHASAAPEEMLRKHTGFADAPLYKRIQQDVQQFLDHIADNLPNEPVIPQEQREDAEPRKGNPFNKYKSRRRHY